MDPRAQHLSRVANGQGKSSSFDMDRAEGGQAQVSAELHERLAAHGLADPDTLQDLWNFNIWSVADLAGVDAEALVQVRRPSRRLSGPIFLWWRRCLRRRCWLGARAQ